jgi:hypothetical protein
VLKNQAFTTAGFKVTRWLQKGDRCHGCRVGTAEAHTLGASGPAEGLLLAEERALIDAIAERLATSSVEEREDQINEHQLLRQLA